MNVCIGLETLALFQLCLWVSLPAGLKSGCNNLQRQLKLIWFAPDWNNDSCNEEKAFIETSNHFFLAKSSLSICTLSMFPAITALPGYGLKEADSTTRGSNSCITGTAENAAATEQDILCSR